MVIPSPNPSALCSEGNIAPTKKAGRNQFLEALGLARDAEESHFLRQEAETRTFFAGHPENLHELFESENKVVLFLPWQEGKRRFVYEMETSRREACIDVEMRFGHGWWERVVDDAWIGLPQQRGERRDWRWELPAEDVSVPVQLELPWRYEVA